VLPEAKAAGTSESLGTAQVDNHHPEDAITSIILIAMTARWMGIAFLSRLLLRTTSYMMKREDGIEIDAVIFGTIARALRPTSDTIGSY
jgi:hypothetical protein